MKPLPGLASEVVEAGKVARLIACVVKVALCVGGGWLLTSVSRTYWPAMLLLGIGLISHAAGRWLYKRRRDGVNVAVARSAVPVAFLLIVLLNVTGLIGTLTGGGSTLLAGASPLLLAMPFYLLGGAAFLVEMAHQRRSLPVPRLLDYLVYLALPFKLLAGPLETPQLLKQIAQYRARWSSSQFVVGWSWLVLGACMKYVIANRLDPARHIAEIGPLVSFLTAAIFELKFYFDFAGYSFMAYGASIAVGLRISRNFDHPFLASNIVLFWRRWHMSLGRFLGRYVLEPNLSLWKGRNQKLVFASSIFLVSAMWHGGTLNYLLWGLFHGLCYYVYGQWLRRREIPAGIGVLSMLLFFVFGRMFAIDADSGRLLQRLVGFLTPSAYRNELWPWHGDIPFLTGPEMRALMAASLFLALEVISSRRHPGRAYHLFRRPVANLVLLLLFVLAGTDTGALLYARI